MLFSASYELKKVQMYNIIELLNRILKKHFEYLVWTHRVGTGQEKHPEYSASE